MVNEKRRTKNEELGGVATYTLAGGADYFMSEHKAAGRTCESIGFEASPQTPVLRS